MDLIRPITPDRSVSPVELTRLTPLERERDKERREREREERRRRQQAAQGRENGPVEPNSGIDVRV